MNNINIDIFQQLCIFTNKFDVYVEYYEDKEIYNIKLKKLTNDDHFSKRNIMPGKIYLNNDKKGNLITYKNSKYILVLN